MIKYRYYDKIFTNWGQNKIFTNLINFIDRQALNKK